MHLQLFHIKLIQRKEINTMNANQSISPKAAQVDSMYRFIPQSKKRELLRLIIQDQFTIKQAAKKLGLNYSTAKYTVKQSKRLGKIKKVSCFKYGDHQIQYAQSLSNFRGHGIPNLNYDINTLRSLNSFNISSLTQPSYPTPNASGAVSDALNLNRSIQQNLNQFSQIRSQNEGDSLSRNQKLIILQEVNKQIHSTQQAIQRTFLLGYILKSQQNPMIQTLFQELQKQLVSIAQNQVAMFTILGRNMMAKPATPIPTPLVANNIPILNLNESAIRQGFNNISSIPSHSFGAFNQAQSSNTCDQLLKKSSPISLNHENDAIKREGPQMLSVASKDFIKEQ